MKTNIAADFADEREIKPDLKRAKVTSNVIHLSAWRRCQNAA
jgi:hypothetical protein